MGTGFFLRLPERRLVRWLSGALLLLSPACVQAQEQARITSLADVAFGTIGNFTSDQSIARDVCIYSSTDRYSVTARGSGTANAFTLASGTNRLAYEVQWADSAGQTAGTTLSPNVALGGQSTFSIIGTACFFGIFRTASLITILRANALSTAAAGNYTGTLTLIIAPT
jgi:hypothetical protein